MAGIGFKLKKLLQDETYFSGMKGFFFATYLVAGPWIVTVFIIGILTWFCGLSGHDYDVFRTSIVYLYAGSLVFTGIYQMPLTRYLADEMFSGRLESLAPSFLGMTIFTSACLGGASFLFTLILPLSPFFRATFVSGMVIVGMLWLAGIYLGCLRDYEKIGMYYVLGSLISFFGTLAGEKIRGLDGAFFGFVFGQGCILLGLTARILLELGVPGLLPSFKCLGSLRKFKTHLFVGFFYNLAIWIDKFIYWFSPLGQETCRGLYSFGQYDTAIYLAYITIIPALGIYLMNIETTFYDTYRNFYGAIMRQFPLRIIETRLEDIKRNLRFTFFELVKVQGAITLLMYYFTPEILLKIHYPLELTTTVRWGVWAAFFQTLFLFVSLILLYFEFPAEACLGSFLYLTLNAGITWIAMKYNLYDYYALGYFVSTVASFVVCAGILQNRLERLIPLTFLRQPIPRESFAGPPLLGADGFLGEIVHPGRAPIVAGEKPPAS